MPERAGRRSGRGRPRADATPEPRQEVVRGEGLAQQRGGGEAERRDPARRGVVARGDAGEEGEGAQGGLVGQGGEGRPVQRGRG